MGTLYWLLGASFTIFWFVGVNIPDVEFIVGAIFMIGGSIINRLEK